MIFHSWAWVFYLNRRQNKEKFLFLLKEHCGQGVLVLLGELGLHSGDGRFEEERNQMLISTFRTNLFEGRDVGCAVFKTDDEQGVIGSKKDEVWKQSPRPAIAITEGMEIFVVSVPFGSNDYGMLSVVDGFLGWGHQVGNTGYQWFVIAKDRITSSHIFCGIFARNGFWGTIG